MIFGILYIVRLAGLREDVPFACIEVAMGCAELNR
jgi:hypothetical protein